MEQERQRKVILAVGRTGAGKSTLLNALINNSVEMPKLLEPANTANNSLGTTTELCYYYSGSGLHQKLLVDTPGFFDRAKPLKEIYNEFNSYVLGLSIGVNRILFVMPQGKLQKSDIDIFALLETLFGKNFYQYSTCVVTHVDSLEMTREKFLETNNADLELQTFLPKFSSVIFGNFRCDREDLDIDNMLKKKRVPFLRAIQREIDAVKNETIEMAVHDWKSFWMRSKQFFLGKVKEGFMMKKLHQAKRLNVRVEDSICLELVMNDVFITSCGHTFHFDCLMTWIKSQVENEIMPPTCPNCRNPFAELVHLKEEKETLTSTKKGK